MGETLQPDIALSLRAIHSAITRGLKVALGRTGSGVAEGFSDTATLVGFAGYVQTLAKVLDAHHLTEDELAFPYFRDLMPEMPFDQLMTDHQRMVPLIEQLESQARSLAGEADPHQLLSDIGEATAAVDTVWLPHIAIEESHWTTERLAGLVTPEENARLNRLFAEHNQKNAQPDALVVPFLLFNLPAEQRRVFADAMPEMVTKELVPITWKEQWQPMAPFLLEQ
jgi:hemerythrin-like domain-containing protein